MGAPVTHFEIISRNGEQMKEFYSKLFGWDINSSNAINYGLVQPQGRGIGGGVGSPGPDGMTHVTFYAEVPDPKATLDKVVSMGGSVVVPVTEIPGMVTFALFNDPDGNRVGIVKDVMPPAPAKKVKAKKASKRKSAGKKRGKRKPARRKR
jgi:predicted enzyme related to lactoylglutathione lyase